MKVLIVDDDVAILRMVETVLRASGHSCTSCESGGPALQAALREHFDLALVDLNLPDIHGFEVITAMKLHNPELPVIVMSALDPREWHDQAIEAGASHFLPKPLRLEVLRHEVELVRSGLADLDIVTAVSSDIEARRLEREFKNAGCRVRRATNGGDTLMLLDDGRTDFAIVDARVENALAAVTACRARGIACFVAADTDTDDDTLLRAGAGMVVNAPVDTSAVLLQARFLVAR